MKLVSHKKTNTVWFHLYEVLSQNYRPRVEWWLKGAGEEENLLFKGIEVQFHKMKKAPEMDGSDSCTAL